MDEKTTTWDELQELGISQRYVEKSWYHNHGAMPRDGIDDFKGKVFTPHEVAAMLTFVRKKDYKSLIENMNVSTVAKIASMTNGTLCAKVLKQSQRSGDYEGVVRYFVDNVLTQDKQPKFRYDESYSSGGQPLNELVEEHHLPYYAKEHKVKTRLM
jgi:hypothetical protein